MKYEIFFKWEKFLIFSQWFLGHLHILFKMQTLWLQIKWKDDHKCWTGKDFKWSGHTLLQIVFQDFTQTKQEKHGEKNNKNKEYSNLATILKIITFREPNI
jgi:hypothetical protein